MQKSIFVVPFYFSFIAWGMIFLPAFAQNTTSATSPATTTASDSPAAVTMPSDPKALMLLAAKTNGLTGDDVKPWHLKARYTVLDENGKTTDQGSYEEFYVSPTKYKRSFTGTDYKYSEYGTEKGVMFSGDQNKQFVRAYMLRHAFINPLPSVEALGSLNFDLTQHESGKVKLACLSMKDDNGNIFGTTWCLDADKPVLRIRVPSHGTRVDSNMISSFQDHFIAGDLQFVLQGKTVLIAHLDSIEQLATIEEAIFQPLADSIPQKVKTISLSQAVTSGRLMKSVEPNYPATAKAVKIQGTVVLQATISRDGLITDLRVISGPAMLQQAARDAVRQWIYKPYLLDGEPIEVETTINIVFAVG